MRPVAILGAHIRTRGHDLSVSVDDVDTLRIPGLLTVQHRVELLEVEDAMELEVAARAVGQARRADELKPSILDALNPAHLTRDSPGLLRLEGLWVEIQVLSDPKTPLVVGIAQQKSAVTARARQALFQN